MKNFFIVFLLSLIVFSSTAQINQAPPNSNLNFTDVSYENTNKIFVQLSKEYLDKGEDPTGTDATLINSIKSQMLAKGLNKKTGVYSLVGVPFRCYAEIAANTINDDLVKSIDKIQTLNALIPFIQQMRMQKPEILGQILIYKNINIPPSKITSMLPPLPTN